MNTSIFRFSIVSICTLLTFAALSVTDHARAQDETQHLSANSSNEENKRSREAKSSVSDEQIAKFQKGLSSTKFVGQFTITGMEDRAPKQEEYTITKVEKMEKGDWWKITARIKYGDHDLTVPMPMEVKWADKTPVITVDRLFIPGLGTFDARVLLRKDKYAGTWAHDSVGGHLFGKIVKLDESGEPSQKQNDTPNEERADQ